MGQKHCCLLFLLLMIVPNLLHAQKNEFSFSLGEIFTSDQTITPAPGLPCAPGSPACIVTKIQTDAGVALEGVYARRVVDLGGAALYAEFPLVGVPGRNVTFSSVPPGIDIVIVSSSALFFTPSAKVKFLPTAPLSPFFSFGGGFAHLSSPGSSSTVGALQFGGGVDFKTPIPLLGFRAEARDFYSGSGVNSSTPATISPRWLNHVFVGGGAVLRF